ncbi:hypothetical protein HNR23_001230 [Nocardiopsis mwathae]|uniref:Uncharacterized protein n=1 Tax=Nocardiopsis mwathae TaxID=1472723 RepID=A0A7X0D4J6_9ACTN|nr:hypothetical protein [Nocardiopsis mwathae]MBB6171170.1 hypothetical protein [Nocardiopsis mwathae]
MPDQHTADRRHVAVQALPLRRRRPRADPPGIRSGIRWADREERCGGISHVMSLLPGVHVTGPGQQM